MSIKTYIAANTAAIHFLQKALDDISEEDYQRIAAPGFQSSVGAHYRHIIEHYQCFFFQEEKQETINYDMRKRNMSIELNICSARQSLSEILEKLKSFRCNDKRELFVSDDHCDYLIRSSLSRELMFLIGHSEHHSAMIAAMLRIFGYSVDDQFGVANATLNFEMRMEEQELSA